jgi:transposase-like protein
MIGLTPVHMTLPGYDSSIGGSGMSSQRYSPEFKEEEARQIVDRGYSVAEVSKRLGGIGAQSLQVGEGDKARQDRRAGSGADRSEE